MEMAEDRGKVLDRLINHSQSLEEHFIKLFTMRNTTNDYNDYVETIANILNVCNKSKVKTKSLKLKEGEYFELLFGINDTFSYGDADVMLNDFYIKNRKKYPTYPYSPYMDCTALVANFHDCYLDFAKYFSNLMSTDKVGGNRIREFEEKVRSFIEEEKYNRW